MYTRANNVKDKRPVNLDLTTIHQPLAAITSIAHRISGIIVFAGTAVLLWLLDTSLASPEGFARLREAGLAPASKFLVWVVLAALAYHMVAGVKHLLMDMGIGESRAGGPRGARITIIVSAVLIVLLGVGVW
jgi:succinate dehydrogenase / fumarate reductase cytochrome b subunit